MKTNPSWTIDRERGARQAAAWIVINTAICGVIGGGCGEVLAMRSETRSCSTVANHLPNATIVSTQR